MSGRGLYRMNIGFTYFAVLWATWCLVGTLNMDGWPQAIMAACTLASVAIVMFGLRVLIPTARKIKENES